MTPVETIVRAGMSEGDQSSDLSFQELRSLRRQPASAARTDEVTAFGVNLESSPAEETYKAVFNVVGQGGTGKTWMLQEFAAVARRVEAAVAWTDGDEEDVVSVMRRIVDEFNRPDAFEEFTEAWQKYATLTAEIYTDKDAPHSVAAILGRAAGKVGLAVARQVPVVGLPLQFVDDDALAEPAAEVATYLAGKFDDSEDRRLVADPVPVMTPLFLQGITRLAKDLSPVLVCFDSFEKTLPFIEGWLRRLLDGGYGGLQRR